MIIKTCPKCGKMKPEAMFPDKRRYCKECRNSVHADENGNARCYKCGETKSISEFYPNTKRCKECQKAADAEYRRKRKMLTNCKYCCCEIKIGADKNWALYPEGYACDDCYRKHHIVLKPGDFVDLPGKTVAIPNDVVNHPSHYLVGGIETLDFIKAKVSDEGYEGYLVGNIIKYLTRYNHKNGLEDLKKAQFYLNKLIELKEQSK